MKKIIKYVELLVKYEILKREDKKHLNKLEQYEIENKTLRVCLQNEEKRTAKFRSCYKDILNEYEDLKYENEKSLKTIQTKERIIKKMEKELKK